MRRVLIVVLSVLFVAAFIITGLSIAMNAVMQPSFLKNQLEHSGIYGVAGDELMQLVLAGGPALETNPAWKIMVTRFHAGYVQESTEEFIDEAFAWLSGASEDHPEFVASRIIPDIEDETGEPLPEEVREALSADVRIENDNLRRWYIWLRIAPIIGGVSSLLALVGIAVFSRTTQKKVRYASLALLAGGLGGKAIAAIIFAFLNIAVGRGADAIEESDMQNLAMPVRMVLEAVPARFLSWTLSVFGGAVLLSLILYCVYAFRKVRTEMRDSHS